MFSAQAPLEIARTDEATPRTSRPLDARFRHGKTVLADHPHGNARLEQGRCIGQTILQNVDFVKP